MKHTYSQLEADLFKVFADAQEGIETPLAVQVQHSLASQLKASQTLDLGPSYAKHEAKRD